MKNANTDTLSKSEGLRKWIITPEVYRNICDTLGRRKPEWGGMLGSSDGIHIDHYYFDMNCKRSSGTYTMNTDDVNRVMHQWNDEENTRFVGIIHSHPNGVTKPSAGDMETVRQIISEIDVNGEFFTPIVQVSSNLDGKIKIYPYTFKESVVCIDQPMEIDHTTPEEKERQRLTELAKTVPNRFARINSILPEKTMERKTVVVVGCGGSRSFIESLARCGIGKFVLFDGDKYEDTNIATQGAYVSEIGKYKVDAIKSRIHDINPLARVITVKHYLDNEIADEDFASVTGLDKSVYSDVLICGCTDNFYAQDRCAQLSLKYGIPYLAAQIFEGGMADEIIFWYPGLTNSCPRCMLETRYKRVLCSDENASGSSAGTAVCITNHLNSTKEIMALNLLCYKDRKTPYFHKLNELADRNYLMTRFSDKFKAPAFAPINKLCKNETDLSFPFLTVAIGQSPEDNCSLCHNKLSNNEKPAIKDTRIIENPYNKE